MPQAGPGEAVPEPRYLQLARTLLGEIESGLHPVGALLPTEFELCDRFGASRFTVREAVKQLVQRGMVSRQAGIGTRVLTARPEAGYRQVMAGIADLRQYSAETELEILDVAMVAPGPDVAELLAGAVPNEAWFRVQGLRRLVGGSARPIAATDIFIHPDFRTVRNLGGRSTVPVYMRIEEQFGERVAEVQQRIRAVSLDPDAARRLDAPAGSPALLVSRTYLNRQGRAIEAAISTHPAERFSYSETFRRERSRGPAGA